MFVVNDMSNALSKIRIPLSDSNQEKIVERETHGTITVVNSEEPCYTCGRHRRMRYPQRIDGKLFVIENCLFCAVRVKTTANTKVD